MMVPVPAARRQQISLTPLIDVVFILLLFFILATHVDRHRGMPLTLAAEIELPA